MVSGDRISRIYTPKGVAIKLPARRGITGFHSVYLIAPGNRGTMTVVVPNPANPLINPPIPEIARRAVQCVRLKSAYKPSNNTSSGACYKPCSP